MFLIHRLNEQMKCAYILLYEKDSVDALVQNQTESIPPLFLTEGFWDLIFQMVALSLQNAYQSRVLSEKLLENTSIIAFRTFLTSFIHHFSHFFHSTTPPSSHAAVFQLRSLY